MGFSGGVVRSDAGAGRIESLVRNSLVRLGVSADGWETLYRDPVDGRLWEHTFLRAIGMAVATESRCHCAFRGSKEVWRGGAI